MNTKLTIEEIQLAANKIHAETKSNNHILAVQHLAELLESEEEIEILNDLKVLQNKYSYLPDSLVTVLSSLRNRFLGFIKDQYGYEAYSVLYDSY